MLNIAGGIILAVIALPFVVPLFIVGAVGIVGIFLVLEEILTIMACVFIFFVAIVYTLDFVNYALNFYDKKTKEKKLVELVKRKQSQPLSKEKIEKMQKINVEIELLDAQLRKEADFDRRRILFAQLAEKDKTYCELRYAANFAERDRSAPLRGQGAR